MVGLVRERRGVFYNKKRLLFAPSLYNGGAAATYIAAILNNAAAILQTATRFYLLLYFT